MSYVKKISENEIDQVFGGEVSCSLGFDLSIDDMAGSMTPKQLEAIRNVARRVTYNNIDDLHNNRDEVNEQFDAVCKKLDLEKIAYLCRDTDFHISGSTYFCKK